MFRPHRPVLRPSPVIYLDVLFLFRPSLIHHAFRFVSGPRSLLIFHTALFLLNQIDGSLILVTVPSVIVTEGPDLLVKLSVTRNLGLDNMQLVKNVILVATCCRTFKTFHNFVNSFTHLVETYFAYSFRTVFRFTFEVDLLFSSLLDTLVNFFFGVHQLVQLSFHLLFKDNLFLLQ